MIIEQLKKSLIAKQEELANRLAATEKDLDKGRSKDFSAQGMQSENEESLKEVHQQTQEELQRIKQTLAMLQTEQYGVCIICGKNISPERLVALPNTKTCFDCSED